MSSLAGDVGRVGPPKAVASGFIALRLVRFQVDQDS